MKTNPETIRRWIRTGKLNAVQYSRKSGNIISEDELQRFIRNTPKYASLATGALAATSFGLSLVAGGLVSTFFLKKHTKVLPSDINRVITKNITDGKASIKRKKEMINQLQGEIAEEQQRIERYEYALNNFDLQEIADEINKEHFKGG